MPESRSLLQRLKSRKLFQWTAAYLATAWLVLQLLDILNAAFHWPDAVQQGAIGMLGIGLLVALVLAWYHGEKGAQRVSGIELVMLAGICMIAAGVLRVTVGRERSPSIGGADSASAGASAAPAPSLVAADARGDVAGLESIAVLPFLDLSPERDQEYFSDGLAEELLDRLAKLPALRVAARTSSFTFKGKDIGVDSIGRALRVGNVLEGSVRKAGGRIRVTVQLIDVRTGYHRWSETYDRTLKDVFAVQDEITGAIMLALVPALAPADSASRDAGALQSDAGTRDLQAYDLYLKGHYYWQRRGAANLNRSIDYFRQAIARDTSFARAYAGLSLGYLILPIFDVNAADSVAGMAMASARRALELDSTLAEAHVALGGAYDMAMRFREGLAQYRTAVALDPGSPTAHQILGFSLLNLGRTDQALAELRHATELDPLALSPATTATLGLQFARRFQEADAALRRALTLDSTYVLALWGLGVVQVYEGQPDSAVSTLERALHLHPDDTRLAANLAFAYAAAGRWDDAEQVRRRLHAPGVRLFDGTEAAITDLVFGDPEPLVRLLSSRQGQLRYVVTGGAFGCNPVFDPLWSYPRFRTAMGELGVEPCTLLQPWPIPPRPRATGAAGSTGR